MTTPIFINGRFLTAPLSGVQRVAFELLEALDYHLDLSSRSSSSLLLPALELLHPPGAHPPRYRQIKSRAVGPVGGQAWEQLVLPIASRSGMLLNLCNMGPVLKRNCFTMIHDAQVHTSPGSYGRAFRLWYRMAQPAIGRMHRRILTVSNYSRDEISKAGIAPRGKISVIPNGCDHISRVASTMAATEALDLVQKRYVVSTANTQHHKNAGVLFKAFTDTRLKDDKLVLFGTATRQDFEDLGFAPPENVIFAGRLSDGEISGLIKGAVCTAWPSLTEGFGLMPLESMALGCPAIIAPCGAMPEVCDGATLAADPNSSSAWVSQIEMLKTDIRLRDRMSKLGRKRAATYNWRHSASMLAAELSSAAPQRSTNPVSSHAASRKHI